MSKDNITQTFVKCADCGKEHNCYNDDYILRMNEVFCDQRCMYSRWPELAVADRQVATKMERYLVQEIRRYRDYVSELRGALECVSKTHLDEKDELDAYNLAEEILENTKDFMNFSDEEKKDEKRLDSEN